MKKILYLSTGGTISSIRSSGGIVPAMGAEAMLELVPSIRKKYDIEARTIMNIDSTNMQPQDWTKLAEAVFEGISRFEGIVITHGTNTMAYTASALSFMIKNPGKPIVITGSQIPIEDEGSDAKRNLIDAFITACEPIAGVFVVFNGRLMIGSRVTKLRTKHPDAFHSINSSDIGLLWNGKVHYLQKPASNKKRTPELHPEICPDVFLIKVFPGLNPDIFDQLLQMGVKGIVIEGYGLGSIPFSGKDFILALKRLIEKGVCTIITTQSLLDGTDLTLYEDGRQCLEIGVIEGRDMTTETLMVKLMWALGQTNNIEEVRKIMETNYAGEMTPEGGSRLPLL
ncbi:MAG: asparaginase [Spirochaetota bacterium]